MRLGAVAALGLIVVLGASACAGHREPLSIRASPVSATFDVPFTVRVRGLPGGARARIRFSGRTRDGRAVRYQVTVRADKRGQASLPDYYLYTHLDPAAGWPARLTITASSGHDEASTHAERTFGLASKVLITDERPHEVGFFGEWTRPPHARHHTAILLFGGSEGGLSQAPLATALAAHGYPVLELAYFAEPGLPQSLTRIPLEYFERALRWLARQPATDPGRIVTFGSSRGGEASLIIASTFPRLVHAAVGYVPSSYVVPSPADPTEPAWTFHGEPVHGQRTATSPGAYGWIRVERIDGPVFVVGGDADALWPSGFSVRDIRARMLAHNRYDITALDYPRAGHEVGRALPRQIELSPVGYGQVQSRYGVLDLGGSPHADEAALEDSWPKLLAFLGRIAHRGR